MDGFENHTQEHVDKIEMQRGWFQETNAYFVDFMNGDIANLKRIIKSVLKENGLNPQNDNVILWMNFAVHAWFGGRNNWKPTDNRQKKLQELILAMRDAFPGARIAWQTSSYIDMDIMSALPAKGDVSRYSEFHIGDVTATATKEIDEPIMHALGVPVVRRYDITAAYRGLQCDGIHHSPHLATNANMWHCYGFGAIEDLILQSGLAALTGADQMPICKAS